MKVFLGLKLKLFGTTLLGFSGVFESPAFLLVRTEPSPFVPIFLNGTLNVRVDDSVSVLDICERSEAYGSES